MPCFRPANIISGTCGDEAPLALHRAIPANSPHLAHRPTTETKTSSNLCLIIQTDKLLVKGPEYVDVGTWRQITHIFLTPQMWPRSYISTKFITSQRVSLYDPFGPGIKSPLVVGPNFLQVPPSLLPYLPHLLAAVLAVLPPAGVAGAGAGQERT